MADFYLDNRRLQEEFGAQPVAPMQPSGYYPASVQRYVAAPDIRYIRSEDRTPDNPAYLESLLSSGMPPEAIARVFAGSGISPDKISGLIKLRQAVRDFQDEPQAYNRRLMEANAKTAGAAAENFRDPSRAVRAFGVDLRGQEPYSPQRAAQDRADVSARWVPFEDAEGRQWLRDSMGRLPSRPLMAGTEQAVKLKDLGTGELESIRENAQQVAQVVKALGMMRGEKVEGQTGDTEATGLKGYLPDVILQRWDDVGVPTRAAVGNVGSLRIKQRSGGAVPAAEMARLKPFVPAETDSPDVVRDKLALFANEYAKMLEEDVAAFKGANRRVPVALENYVKERVGMARGVMSGRQKASEALAGQTDPMAVLQALKSEIARRSQVATEGR